MTKHTSSNINRDVDTKSDEISNEVESKENVSGLEIKQQNGMTEQKGNEFL